MSDAENTGSNAIWAVALIIIVAMIVGAIIYGGKFFNANSEKKVDINVTAPSGH